MPHKVTNLRPPSALVKKKKQTHIQNNQQYTETGHHSLPPTQLDKGSHFRKVN